MIPHRTRTVTCYGAGALAVLAILTLVLTDLQPADARSSADRPSGRMSSDPGRMSSDPGLVGGQEVSGKITKKRLVGIRGRSTENLVVQLDGRRVVDLGDARLFDNVRISKGDRLTAWGPKVNIGGRSVILADTAQINGRRIDLTRDSIFHPERIIGWPLAGESIERGASLEAEEMGQITDRRGRGSDWYFDSYEVRDDPFRHRYAMERDYYEDTEFERRGTQRSDRRAREDQQAQRQGGKEGFRVKSDRQLKRDIENEFTWSPWVDPDDVRVSVNDGVVTLKGTVENRTAVEDAIDNAYDAGAKDVINELTTREG